MGKKKILIIIAIVLLGTISITGITYAVYTWGLEFDITGQVSGCFDIVYKKGRDIGSNENSKELLTGGMYYDGLSTTVEAKLIDTCDAEKATGILYLNVDSSTSSGLLNSNALKYQVIDGNNLSSSGTLNTVGNIEIANDISITKKDKAITVFVWIDRSLITDDNYEQILSSNFNGSISFGAESR